MGHIIFIKRETTYSQIYSNKWIHFFFLNFIFIIYPPDLHESDGGAMHRASNYHDLLPEAPKYCCPLEIFYFVFLVL